MATDKKKLEISLDLVEHMKDHYRRIPEEYSELRTHIRNLDLKAFKSYDLETVRNVFANEEIQTAMGYVIKPHHAINFLKEVDVDPTETLKTQNEKKGGGNWARNALGKVFDEESLEAIKPAIDFIGGSATDGAGSLFSGVLGNLPKGTGPIATMLAGLMVASSVISKIPIIGGIVGMLLKPIMMIAMVFSAIFVGKGVMEGLEAENDFAGKLHSSVGGSERTNRTAAITDQQEPVDALALNNFDFNEAVAALMKA